MPECESNSVNKSDKRALKPRRAVKRIAYKKHPRIKHAALLLYLSVRTALPSRYVFFDILSAQY
jgi:hypothetical protein